MSTEKLAGTILIVGFILFLVGTFLSPPKLYEEPDIQKRLEMVEVYKSRFVASQVVSALGIIVPALGFLVLANSYKGWMAYVGAGAFVVGSLFAAYYLYQYIVEPAAIWSIESPFGLDGYNFLTFLGGLLFGIVFLSAGIPAWLGFGLAGYSVLAVVIMLFQGSGAAFFVSGVFYIITFIAGIVLIRQ